MNAARLGLVIKNLFRKPVRSIAVLVVAALAGGLIFSASTILASVKKSLERSLTMLGADIMVVPSGHEDRGRKVLLAGTPSSFYMDREAVPRINALQGVEKASPQLFITSSILDCCSMPTVLLVAYDPETDFTITPWVQMTHHTNNEAIDEVTVGTETLYASEGPAMTFFGKRFKIGKSLHRTGVGFLDFSIFMTMDSARDMILNSASRSRMPLHIDPNQISSVLVKIGEGHDVDRVAADIEKALPHAKALAAKALVAAVRRDAQTAMWGLIAGGAAAWVMLLALNGLVYMMVINERRREFGILRALGAARIHVFGLVVSEAAILSGSGALVGSATGWVAIRLFKSLITAYIGKATFTLPSPFITCAAAAVCALFFFLTGAASAAYPALRVSRRDPDEAIKQ